jgi:deoxycytidine triphosphate deaminase
MGKIDSPELGFLNKDKIKDVLYEYKVIDPIKEGHFQGMHYIITIGDTGWVPATDITLQKKDITPGRNLVINPGKEAIIRSIEKLKIPNFLLAHIDPLEIFGSKGVIVNSPIILEPGSFQYLFFSFSNQSDIEIQIEKGKPLAKVYFERINEDAFREESIKLVEVPPQLPNIIKEDYITYPKLVTKVKTLQKEVTKSLHNDHELISSEISDAGDNLIKPFINSCLLPNGYLLRVGNRVNHYFHDEHGTGRKYEHIGSGQPFTIRANDTVILRIKEQIFLQDNMDLELRISDNFSKRYIEFICSNDIYPGYKGFVWCYLHNNGTSDIKIEYEEPLLVAKFIQLGVRPDKIIGKNDYQVGIMNEELSQGKELERPTNKWDDLVVLTEKVKHLENDIRELGAAKVIIELVFMAVVAGIVIALILALIKPIQEVVNQYFHFEGYFNNSNQQETMVSIIWFIIKNSFRI